MLPIRASVTMRVLLPVLVALALGCGGDSAGSQTTGPGDTTANPTGTVHPRTTVTMGGFSLSAEMVWERTTRSVGYSGRSTGPSDVLGMLFIWPDDCRRSFWMKDTRFDLSIAFIDADRRIINFADMTKLDDVTLHSSTRPARYALEARRGWFADKRIAVGTQVEFTLPTNVVPQTDLSCPP